jgi:predicted nucleic acid-binding protein
LNVSYIIDTDWAVHHLNGVRTIRAKLKQLQPEGLGLSIISLAELYEGVIYSHDPEKSKNQFEEFLSSVTVIEITDEICRIFGQQRGILRRQGLMIGDFDLIIATTCLHYNFTLLTNNLRHLERIEGLKIITIDSQVGR